MFGFQDIIHGIIDILHNYIKSRSRLGVLLSVHKGGQKETQEKE
jgi:hypothetical protein